MDVTVIAAILFLATFTEGLTEYIFAGVEAAQPYLKYVALVFGVVLAVAYHIDIPAMLGLTASFGFVNFVVSGLIIGRGSNYVNDVITGIRGKSA